MQRTYRRRAVARALFIIFVGAMAPGSAGAGETTIAVAANFTDAAREIGALFESATGNRTVFSFGPTGQLYAQIVQGAPYDAFLAADGIRPGLAIANGLAVAGSRFTYATGRLVLYSRDKARIRDGAALHRADIARIAIANPRIAPYGSAAVAAMRALGVYDRLRPKIVQGNSIAQTYQFVYTGNAEIGFVARSQVARHADGSRWMVPEALYPAIAQDAVLLNYGADNTAARAFLAFLRGPQARLVKEKFGYGAGE